MLVSARFQHCGNIVAEVLGLIKSTWCFDSFFESRWLGLGASARTLVTATSLLASKTWCSLCERHLERASTT